MYQQCIKSVLTCCLETPPRCVDGTAIRVHWSNQCALSGDCPNAALIGSASGAWVTFVVLALCGTCDSVKPVRL